MTKLRTSDALLKALEESSPRRPSRAQMEKQRLSFVMGSLDEENDMTREEVQSVLEQQDGRALNV
ncbi:hypothetical protein [Rhodobium gokarnense]|uniref:Uncharacterized protein n=1 Tax=Rhodobium gokarnense TaxID=364296 RepID=A0ABT3HJ35_9HYPH|nr:hypothetical protein [Rhodobium gokarnense]MCW2310276.1 hypothetical protein [Rhodobium gokarnense]